MRGAGLEGDRVSGRVCNRRLTMLVALILPGAWTSTQKISWKDIPSLGGIRVNQVTGWPRRGMCDAASDISEPCSAIIGSLVSRCAIVNRRIMPLLTPLAVLLLPGCWTPPTANVLPHGPSRLIQKGIVVESVVRLATVQSVDPVKRMIVLQVPGTGAAAAVTGTAVAGTPGERAYRAGPNVPDLGHLPPGTKVRARVSENLTVYVSNDGRLPGAEGVPVVNTPSAKVLSVDPSYRLLTLQYPDRQVQTFKVGREVQLSQMQAGDAVMIQTPEIVSLSVGNHWLAGVPMWKE